METEIQREKDEISRILAENFTPEEYDPSDFEWCAYQLQQEGFHRERDVAIKLLNQILIEIRREVYQYNKAAKKAINDDLYLVYRAKSVAAQTLYSYAVTLYRDYLKERNKNEKI